MAKNRQQNTKKLNFAEVGVKNPKHIAAKQKAAKRQSRNNLRVATNFYYDED